MILTIVVNKNLFNIGIILGICLVACMTTLVWIEGANNKILRKQNDYLTFLEEEVKKINNKDELLKFHLKLGEYKPELKTSQIRYRISIIDAYCRGMFLILDQINNKIEPWYTLEDVSIEDVPGWMCSSRILGIVTMGATPIEAINVQNKV